MKMDIKNISTYNIGIRENFKKFSVMTYKCTTERKFLLIMFHINAGHSKFQRKVFKWEFCRNIDIEKYFKLQLDLS